MTIGLRPRAGRVPEILQMTTTDCAAACLAMVCAAHRREFSLAACRERLNVSRDGVSARTLIQASRTMGLTARGYLAAADSLSEINLPAILHSNDEHYVVLERISARTATIVDPAIGRRRTDLRELAASMSGLVVTFARSDDDPVPATATTVHRRRWSPWWDELRQHLHGLRPELTRTLASAVLVHALALTVPLLTAAFIGRVAGGRAGSLLALLPLLMGSLVLAQFAAGRARQFCLLRVERVVDARLADHVIGHLLSLPVTFFEQRANGDLRQRIASTFEIREALTTQTIEGLLDLLLSGVYLTVLVWVNVPYGAAVAAFSALLLAAPMLSARRLRHLQYRQLIAQAKSQTTLGQVLDGIATVKATGTEDEMQARWRRQLDDELACKQQHDRLKGTVENLVASLQTLAPLATLWLGAYQAATGAMGLGEVIALQTLAISALMPLSGIARTVQQLQAARAHVERIKDILQAQPERRPQNAGRVPLRGRVHLRDVTFRYNIHQAPVIDNVSLDIEPGSKVAIVGRSGSGKSTLAMLLVGLYTPTSGEVFIDGTPVANLDPRRLRRQAGVVLQDSFLFAGTIRENLSLANTSTDQDALDLAARRACIDADIAAMPMGYETRIGEGGKLISGGQRQRLALARALVNDPAILLLDEATSHLDPITEGHITSALDALPGTRIVIAHRLDTVRSADDILVLDQGRLVERGTHRQLLARGGFYTELIAGNRREIALD